MKKQSNPVVFNAVTVYNKKDKPYEIKVATHANKGKRYPYHSKKDKQDV